MSKTFWLVYKTHFVSAELSNVKLNYTCQQITAKMITVYHMKIIRNLEEVSADDWQSVGVVSDAVQVFVGRQDTAEYLQEELQRELIQEVNLQRRQLHNVEQHHSHFGAWQNNTISDITECTPYYSFQIPAIICFSVLDQQQLCSQNNQRTDRGQKGLTKLKQCPTFFCKSLVTSPFNILRAGGYSGRPTDSVKAVKSTRR